MSTGIYIYYFTNIPDNRRVAETNKKNLFIAYIVDDSKILVGKLKKIDKKGNVEINEYGFDYNRTGVYFADQVLQILPEDKKIYKKLRNYL